MVKNLVLNVRDVVERMNVIMLLLSREGVKDGRRVRVKMRMMRVVVVRKGLRLLRRRGWESRVVLLLDSD